MYTVVFYDSDDELQIKSFKNLANAETFIDEDYFDNCDHGVNNARILVDYESRDVYKTLYEDMKKEFFAREITRTLK